jgi:transposase
LLLYDLTSTYFEGAADQVEKAAHGYSRDHRPDCPQIVLGLVVSSDGFPLSYEIFEGNRADVTTLPEMVRKMEARHGKAGRVWVMDRGLVSEENLEFIAARGGSYLVGTPRRKLAEFEKQLLEGPWEKVPERPGLKVQLIQQEGEVYVLARSEERAQKELAMRRRVLQGLKRDLKAFEKAIRNGRIKSRDRVQRRLGRMEERWARGWPCLKEVGLIEGRLRWKWDSRRLRRLRLSDGAYLLRTNLEPLDPDLLWRHYIQLTEVEEAFRVLKSELNIRPIWHRLDRRVEAHVLVAFLAYCLWVCLKQKLKAVAGSLSPARVLESLKSIQMVEVWFGLRAGGSICLPRITEPEPEQQLILHHLGWALPEHPPPKIYQKDLGKS